MSYGPLFAALILSAPLAQAEQVGVVFAMGGERFVLTPACAQRVEHATGDAGLVQHPGAAVAAAEFLRGVPHAEAP
ncbi:hypothetical protein [Halomonas sp. M4R1S46]|uniref:hypothetical protein n=1 Tax=Halomonas sp. M4R1S46 TaxID=2982692 RepID=UPI0021E5047C|nr:hypothetical protein [Halomonas sp. M4R1S46]UYG06611.1 hypothetical protein OCT48_13385 [Halomonas sp. M4R1S46]